jgi:hypothetical protein
MVGQFFTRGGLSGTGSRLLTGSVRLHAHTTIPVLFT